MNEKVLTVLTLLFQSEILRRAPLTAWLLLRVQEWTEQAGAQDERLE